MKKALILLFAVILSGSLFAQKKIYLSLGAGIGFGTASSYELYQDGDKAYPVALGKAVGANLHLGYFLNDFMAIDLGVSYKIGLNTKIDASYNINPELKADQEIVKMKYHGNMLQLVPGIVFSPSLDGKIRPYTRVGLIIAVMNSITTEIDDDYPYGGHFIGTLKYSGGIALGGSLAVGADYALGETFSIYAELYYDALSYSPTKGEFKKAEVDGVDVLSDWTTYDKEVEFVDDITNFEPDNSKPDQQLKTSYPFNSLGLNIGVKIKL
jgi:opacity protein-like surface antigen